MSKRSDELLRHVASRKRMASLGLWLYRLMIALAIAYAVGLLVSRVFNVASGWFTPLTIAAVPGLAAAAALLLHRGINRAEAARLVDTRTDAKDLYLTAALIDGTPGEYQPLVESSAESRAGEIKPATVVPFDPWTKLTHVVVALALLLVGAAWLPQFDPFGKQQEQRRLEERVMKLKEDMLAAEKKIEAIRKQEPDAEVSKEVENALAELKETFNQLKKDEKQENNKQLAKQMQRISDKWRQAKEKNLKNTDRDKMMQQLGTDIEKQAQWKKDLNEGKTDSLDKQIQEIKELAAQAQNETNELERNKKQQEIAKKIQELSDFAKGNTSSKELSEAIQKALEQAQQAGDKQSAQEALDALKKQMDLTQAELEQLAQNLRDQKSLEDALQAIRQAQQANNQQNGMDGQQCQGCESLAEYQKLFEQLGGGQGGNPSASADGQGQGNNGQGDGKGGLGGQGQGKGGVAPEAPDQKTDFKSEKVKQAIQAGKILLEWKTQEEADPGEAKVDYAEQVEKVKQGAAEAIVTEQIPPGYHEGIQKYFDNYEKEQKGGEGQKQE